MCGIGDVVYLKLYIIFLFFYYFAELKTFIGSEKEKPFRHFWNVFIPKFFLKILTRNTPYEIVSNRSQQIL